MAIDFTDALQTIDALFEQNPEEEKDKEEVAVVESEEVLNTNDEADTGADLLLNEIFGDLNKEKEENEIGEIKDQKITPKEEANLKSYTPRKMVNGKLVSDIEQVPGSDISTPEKPPVFSPQWFEDLPTLKEVEKEIEEVINIYKGEDDYTTTKTNLVNDLGEAIEGITYENLPPGNKLPLQEIAVKKLEEEYKEDEVIEYEITPAQIDAKAAEIYVSMQEDIELKEEDTLIEKVPYLGKNPASNYLGDVYRSFGIGWTGSNALDETFKLWAENPNDENILAWIMAVNAQQDVRQTDEMRNFYRIYEEEGKTPWAFIKALSSAPYSIIQNTLASSMGTMIGSLQADEVKGATVTGAIAGGAVGAATPVTAATGAMAGGFGAGVAMMEAGLTFSELLMEETGNDLTLENVKAVFDDPERVEDIKRKARNRGIAIGLIEMVTAGLAKGVGSRIISTGGRKTTSVLVGGGIEVVGGSTGEVAGRFVAGQEMDVADIALEGIGGLKSGPLTIGSNLLQSRNITNELKIRNDLRGSEYNNIIEAFKIDTPTGEAKINITQNPEAINVLDRNLKKAVTKGEITQEESNNIQVNFRETTQAVNQIKAAGIVDIKDQSNAITLLKRKNALQKQIEAVDDSGLNAVAKEEVKKIDEELTGIIASEIERQETVGMGVIPTRRTKKEEISAEEQADLNKINIDTYKDPNTSETDRNNAAKLIIEDNAGFFLSDKGGIDFDANFKGYINKNTSEHITRQEVLNEINAEIPSIINAFTQDKGANFTTYAGVALNKRLPTILESLIGAKEASRSKEMTAEELAMIPEPKTETQETQGKEFEKRKYPTDVAAIEKQTANVRPEILTNIKNSVKQFIASSVGKVKEIGGKGKKIITKLNPSALAKELKAQNTATRAAVVAAIGKGKKYKDFVTKVINDGYIETIPIAAMKKRFKTVKGFNIEKIGRETLGAGTGIYKLSGLQEQALIDFYTKDQSGRRSFIDLLAKGLTIEQFQEVKIDPEFMKDLDFKLKEAKSELTAEEFMNEVERIYDGRTKEFASLDKTESLKDKPKNAKEAAEKAIKEIITEDNIDNFKDKDVLDKAIEYFEGIDQEFKNTLYGGIPVTPFIKAIKVGLKAIRLARDTGKTYLQSLKSGLQAFTTQIKGIPPSQKSILEAISIASNYKAALKILWDGKIIQPDSLENIQKIHQRDLETVLNGNIGTAVVEASNFGNFGAKVVPGNIVNGKFVPNPDSKVKYYELFNNDGSRFYVSYPKKGSKNYVKRRQAIVNNPKYKGKFVPDTGAYYGKSDPAYEELMKAARENDSSPLNKQLLELKPTRIVIPTGKRKIGKRGTINKDFLEDNADQIAENQEALRIYTKILEQSGQPLSSIAPFITASYQATTGLIKISAGFKGASKVFRYGKERKHRKGEKYREEHSPPASVIGATLLWAIKYNHVDITMDAIVKNYGQIQLSKLDDARIDNSGFAGTLPEGMTIFDDNVDLARLAASDVNLNTIINPKTKETLVSEMGLGLNPIQAQNPSLVHYQNMLVLAVVKGEISQTKASKHLKVSIPANIAKNIKVKWNAKNLAPEFLSKDQRADQQKQALENSLDTQVDAQKVNKKKKGISVFDFDDTLAKTKEKVIVNMPQNLEGLTFFDKMLQKEFDKSPYTRHLRSYEWFWEKDFKKSANKYFSRKYGFAYERFADLYERRNKVTELYSDYSVEELRAKLKKAKGENKENIKLAIQENFRIFGTETTAVQDSGIDIYTGKAMELTPAEFAEQAQTLEEQGATFDFSQFENVKGAKKGPLADLALRRQGKFGSGDIFILTARPQISAQGIKTFLDGIGLNIPLKNITGLEDGTSQAKARWVLQKTEKGYNDFYFADDAIQNVTAVKQILDQVDVKSKVQQAIADKTINLDKEFNKQIEEVTGKEAYKEYSPARAKLAGRAKDKGFFKWLGKQLTITPSAEDFMGLMYDIIGKGKQGNRHAQFISDNLIKPYNKAEQEILSAKVTVANDFAALKNAFPSLKTKRGKNPLMQEIGVGPYTKSNALRVYMWNKQGMEIPGLSNRDRVALVEAVEADSELNVFADEVILIQKESNYPPPGNNWTGGDITTDILQGLDKGFRNKLMTEFNENAAIIFSEENMNKLEALYGAKWIEALKDSLRRMKSGSNRPVYQGGGARIVNEMLDWLNGSVGAVMFLNVKSGLLQLISNVNFINWGDNNIYQASKAFASKEYWPTVLKLMNSDYLVNRRDGLKINVNEAELADTAKKNGMKGAIAYLLDKGFVITRIMDSLAIATGGATFYINRRNALLNRVNPETGKKYTQAEAEAKAFDDFYAISEESQQSSNPSKISQQQASLAGRVLLAFQNVTMQYNRMTKKSIRDLYNRRKTPGMTQRESDLGNLSKIVYYTTVQNVIFNALQQALFVLLFDDESDEEEKDRAADIAHGMVDSLLFGLGFGGAAISTVKNVTRVIMQETDKKSPDYEEAVWEVFNVSPVLDSKIRKLRTTAKTFSWNMEEIKKRGWSLDNPTYLAVSQLVSAATNIPIDRVMRKMMNMRQAMDEETKTWQRVALILGWTGWSVGLPYWGLQSTIKQEEKAIEKAKVDYKNDIRKLKAQGYKKVMYRNLKDFNSDDIVELQSPAGTVVYYVKTKKKK